MVALVRTERFTHVDSHYVPTSLVVLVLYVLQLLSTTNQMSAVCAGHHRRKT